MGGVRGELGPTGSVGLRASTVLHLADGSLTWQSAFLSEADASLHDLSLAMHLHPLLFFLLGNDWLGWTLGSVNVRLGLGPVMAVTPASTRFALGWDWGAGIDAPLGDPDVGRSLWLGFEYRRVRALADDWPAARPTQSMLLRLGYRVNVL